MDKRQLKYVGLAIVVVLWVMLASPVHPWMGLTQSVIAQTTTDTNEVAEQAITEAVILELVQDRDLPVTPEIRRITTVGEYALAAWIWGEAGGQSLVQLDDSNQWKVIESGGGAMDVSVLEQLGVPTAEAEQLVLPNRD